MQYDFTALPNRAIPKAADPLFQHLIDTYVSEANKVVSLWKAVPDGRLGYRPHERMNDIRTILQHQLLSERRFFAQFVGTPEPAVETLLPPSPEAAGVAAYIEKYLEQIRPRLEQLAAGTREWWLEERPFFGLHRQRIWIFWRRVLHTAHHRTQVQTYLRLAGEHVPAIYGPSGDVTWDGADPTYSTQAASRG